MVTEDTRKTLHTSLAAAQKKVKVGGIYSHFKHPENHYKVINLAFLEATLDICVVYQALYDPKLVFVRDLKNWLETPELNGKKVPRFSLIS